MENICSTYIPNCTETAVIIVAILGTVLLIYSQFVEAENRRDLIRMVGAAMLFVYALYVADGIFMTVTAGIFFASLIEFLEIYLGMHKHNKVDIDRYKKMKY